MSKSAPIGHNTVAADKLKILVERIEMLTEEKQEIADSIKEVFAQAKGEGYDTKAIRKIIKLRTQDATERDEEEAVLEAYKHALGLLSGTPLGEAALKKTRL